MNLETWLANICVKMKWFIETGETILRDQRFEMTLEFHFENIYNSVDFTRTYDLWQCEDKYAPLV